MASSGFVFATLLLLAVLHAGSALKCFQCGEEKGDGICRDDRGIENVFVDCADSCITHTLAPISFNGTETVEIIMRSCADPSYCTIGTALFGKKLGLNTRSCTSCNSNYCNSASTAIPSFILLAILAVKYYFL